MERLVRISSGINLYNLYTFKSSDIYSFWTKKDLKGPRGLINYGKPFLLFGWDNGSWGVPFKSFSKWLFLNWFLFSKNDHVGNRYFFSKFSPEFGLNQDCNIEPVIAKSQVCDCKITSLWLRSHKSVTAKSQVCECKVTRLWLQSHRPVTAKSHACDCKVTKGWCQCSKIIKYAFHMIVVCVCWANRTLCGNLWGLSGSKLCVRL